jgi:hypothetical protein
VGAGDDTKRAIGRAACIDVEPHGNERFQYVRWWANVEHALLLRPTGKGRVFNPFLDWNVNVLV